MAGEKRRGAPKKQMKKPSVAAKQKQAKKQAARGEALAREQSTVTPA